MTRDDAFELLQIRWRLLGTRFDRDTPDLWAEALGELSYQTARPVMIDLCKERDRVTLADFHQALTPKAHRPYDVTDVWTPELETHRDHDPNARPDRTPSVFADQVRAQMAAKGTSEYAQRIRDELNAQDKAD